MVLASDKLTAIIGLGLTGLACARYLKQQNRPFVAFDAKVSEQTRAVFNSEFANHALVEGDLNEQDFSRFSTIVLSPGVPLSTPSIAEAKAQGCQFENDITLFMSYNKSQVKPAKIAAVTGSNGKSTVVAWLQDILQKVGLNAHYAGNIGVSPLQLLELDEYPEVVVLELSSFQLEIIERLDADVAAMLNLSPDHLDRYDSMMAYHSAKQRVYRGASTCVCNRDEPLTQALVASGTQVVSFGSNMPDLKQWGIVEQGSAIGFGPQTILDKDRLPLIGKHNVLNAQAVIAMACALGLERDEALINALCSFEGLPHRCQKVATNGGVTFVDDSKATNTGACIAAVKGLPENASVVLLAGGIAKGADLSELKQILPRIKAAVVFGESAQVLAKVFETKPVESVDSMIDAVSAASSLSEEGDIVLLSPACASFDMFKSYADRGEQFQQAVKQSIQEAL